MADENQIENNTQEPTPIEAKAMEQGWVPQDQWEGEPDAWRPAKEFVDRGELFSAIADARRENKQLKIAMEEFGRHHARVKELEYKRALESLKAAKKEALSEGDVDAVVNIDEQIDEVKETHRAASAAPTQDVQPDPRFVTWQEKNPWYASDRIMRVAADEVAREAYSAGERDNGAILAIVEKAIRKEFPHKFVNPNRERASAVEGSNNKGRTTKNDSVDMPDADRRIMDKLVKTGVITREKYLEEYKATQGRGA